MKTKHILVGAVAVFGLALGVQVSNAATICSGCEAIDGAPGTYLGPYNTITSDHGTFTHTDLVDNVGNMTSFVDFWVFDLDGGGSVSMSANYTTLTGINNFAGTLWSDGGSTNCGSAIPTGCSVIALGLMLGSASGNNWEILTSLATGRYILEISGETRINGSSAYSGQLGTVVPLPGAFILLATSLMGLGFVRRKQT
ncbi:MAG: hypothetical protein OER80_11625 [Gammaproteobacteria bacterium]|nr:hypothetical protein [Gammaproteobacteria bacterium]